jgi:hypothetical protein
MSINRHKSLFELVALFTLALLLTLAMPLSAQTKGQPPESDAQRAARIDQMQQQQQQQQQDDAVRNAGRDLADLQSRISQEQAERAKLRQLARENFRRHYEMLSEHTETLVRLTADLQASVEGASTTVLPADMRMTVGKIQKLAHELRGTIVGRRVAKVKAIKGADAVLFRQNPLLTERSLLLERVAASSDLAILLKKTMDQYLLEDNKTSVTVGALQRDSHKDKFDPQLANIMATSFNLERIAAAIRANPGSTRLTAVNK